MKEYYGTPFDNADKQFIYFEVFDTEKFLDSDIESKILIQIKDITDHKVQASFVVNDELIKIEYDGYLNLVFGYEKETFLSQ